MLSPLEGLKAETRFVTRSRRSTSFEHFACSPVTPRSADTTSGIAKWELTQPTGYKALLISSEPVYAVAVPKTQAIGCRIMFEE